MAVPTTTGQLRTKISDMLIGDYIVCNYSAASGAVGTFSNLGGVAGTEIPTAGSATPNGSFYLIKTDKGLLIADRVVQHSVSWDVLNTGKVIQGLPWGNIIPTMTSNTTPSGVASASSVYSSAYPEWSVFDKNASGTSWQTTNGITISSSATQWIAYDFGVAKRITKYSLAMRWGTGATYYPKTWTFEGWDGTNWVVLHSVDKASNTWVGTGAKEYYTPTTVGNYAKYRLNCSAVFGGSFLDIGEIEMFETVGIIRSLTGGVAFADYTDKRIVSLLLHGDGVDGSTTFTDSSPAPKAITRGGTALIKTDQSKFGGSSLYLNGTTDYLSMGANEDFTFGNGNFTTECWIKRSRIGVGEYIMGQSNADTSLIAFLLNFAADNTLRFLVYNGTAFFSATSTNTLTDINNWHHIACVRSGTNLYLYVDGVQWATAVIGSNSVATSTNQLSIGRGGEMTTSFFQGYIDEVRIIKGKAEYVANFTPPTQPYNEPNNTLIGGFSSTTDLGFGAFPINNEWDKYIVNFPVDKIQVGKTLNDIFNWSIAIWAQDTPTLALGASTNRIRRGGATSKTFNSQASSVATTTYGLRPVFDYKEV